MAPASRNFLTMNASFFTGMPTIANRDTNQMNTETQSKIETGKTTYEAQKIQRW
jgi:hypothetical protein